MKGETMRDDWCNLFNLQIPEFHCIPSRGCLPVWVLQLEKWQQIQGDTGVQLAETKTPLVYLFPSYGKGWPVLNFKFMALVNRQAALELCCHLCTNWQLASALKLHASNVLPVLLINAVCKKRMLLCCFYLPTSVPVISPRENVESLSIVYSSLAVNIGRFSNIRIPNCKEMLCPHNWQCSLQNLFFFIIIICFKAGSL